MKQNFKIIFCLGIVFLSSFLVLGLFLEAYSQGILTSQKNITSVGGIFNQNPKQVTLDVIQNVLNDSKMNNVNINNLGFRGAEFEEVKPKDTFRIFLLGSSQIFGTGATSDDTTIPGYLENSLKNNKSFSLEVINSGMQGVDSRKELLLLQNMLLDLSPDLVVVYDGFNDLRAGTSSTQLFDNWNSMCNLGQKYNFDVVVVLQPIVGFGEKSLTPDELLYLQKSKDYENNNLLDSLNQYEVYAENLIKLQNCTDKIDLRSVFDNESQSIYIDEDSHYSDRGNSIVANSILSKISEYVSEENIFNQTVNSDIQPNNSDTFTEFGYILDTTFSNLEKKLTLIPFSLSENDKLSQKIVKSKELVVETQSLLNENTEISIVIEISPHQNESTNDKIIKLTTMNKTTNSLIHNVTYLMTITKNGNELFTNYFFAEDELLIEVIHDNDIIKISGERRYTLDSLTATPNIPITISGNFFEPNSTYKFDIGLRTIHNSENFIVLNGFNAEISP